MSVINIIRAANGAVVHIGDWDYRWEDRNGETVAANPLPEGAYEDSVEIIEGEDGSRIAADDYRNRRLAAYPSVHDQLDMLYWDNVNGTATWSEAIAQVKARFPKSQP